MLEFIKNDMELIMVYTPAYGADEVLKKIKSSEGHNIKNTFGVEQKLLRELEEYDEESVCISVGKVTNGYIEISRDVIGTEHKFFFSKDIKLNQKMFVAYRNISILKKLDQVIDGDVYIGGDETEAGYNISLDRYKMLVEVFPNSSELTMYAHKRIAALVKEFAPQCDKYEHIYEKYIEKREHAYLKGNCLNNSSINRKIKLEQFSIALSELRSLLNEVEHIGETTWQQKIENILQLLYPQYILCTRELTFKGIDGYDKRPDFILVDANGFIDIMEIKKPTVDVLSKQASYRNNYVPAREFAGAIQQIEKYIFCLNSLNREKDCLFVKLSKMLPEDVKPQAVNPQGILLLGRSKDFDEQQTRDFELIKRQYKNIADIMTYDDLISRFERIIDSLKENV